MDTDTYIYLFSLFFNRHSMYVERLCAVRRVPNNPTVLCTCYIICRVNTNQRSGFPDTQTWYNCNISKRKRD
jgi:hypothetical protein